MNSIKIIDFLTKKQVWQYYKLYCNTQWYSDKEMKAFQLMKLKKLLKHCYENVPYYRNVIDNNEIDIVNFNSLKVLECFPLLTKEIIQANYNEFIPDNLDRITGTKTTQTGGTTGNILFKRNDAKTRSSIWGSYKRYEDWMGLKPSDKTLVLMGGQVKKFNVKQKIISKLNNWLKNSISVDIYNASNETLETVILLLQNNSFSQIRSYPQFLFAVAKKLEMKGLNFRIKSISTTAEPVMKEHRALFRKVFNAEVYDQYGCGEIGGIAYECEEHKGLHITEERVIIEVNAFNEIIITDLDNYSMPFIRYWNADQVVVSDKLCSCGRKSRLIEQVMGRTCDYVVGQNGQFLHWAYFWHLIFDSNVAIRRNLRKFQIVQISTNELVIRLVSDPLLDKEKEYISSDINKRLGNMEITFCFERDIENTITGKYRPVINKIL